MNIKSLALGAALGLGAAATNAATFTAYDTPTSPVGVALLSPESFSLAYDTSGWASIESATLYVTLGDDGDWWPEGALTKASGNGAVSYFGTAPISSSPTEYNLGSVLDLVALGGTSLTGTVFGLGDFLYSGAKLVFEYTPTVTPVPEASELWMLGAGLLAVGGIAVKRKSIGRV